MNQTPLTNPVYLDCAMKIVIRQHNPYHSQRALDYEYRNKYYKYYNEALVLLIEFCEFYGYFKTKPKYLNYFN
jgi:hypothetical protein